MTTVVTGASGHVGANLVRELLARGRAVRAVVHTDTRALEGLPVERVTADVCDAASLREAFAGAEVVYHLAAVISIAKDGEEVMRRVNVEGPRNVVEACLATGVRRLIHFSSIHAFSHLPVDQVIDENRPFASGEGTMAYDRTKVAGQQHVLDGVRRGLNAVIIHPTSVVGPEDYKPSHLGQVLLDLYRRRLPALVGGGFDWVDVRDVVQGALAAEERGKVGERYLLSGKWESVVTLARVAEAVTGVRAPRFVSPTWLARLGVPFMNAYDRLLGRRSLYTASSLRALSCHKWVSSAKAQDALGYRPRPLRETIADTYAWFKQAGML